MNITEIELLEKYEHLLRSKRKNLLIYSSMWNIATATDKRIKRKGGFWKTTAQELQIF